MRSYTSPRPTYSSSELNIALHNGNALRMDRTKVPKRIPSDFVGFDTVFVRKGLKEVGLTHLRIGELGRLLPLLEERG